MNPWSGQTQGVCIDGVNSAVRADMIGQNQLAWMLNGTVRDGKARTRSRLIERLVLPDGKVQGAGYFSLRSGKLIFSISGIPYRVSVSANDFLAQEISLPWRNSATRPMAWMCET